MLTPYAFLAGVIVGAVGYHFIRKKLRKTFTSAPKDKAKGVLDSFMDSFFGKKGGKK